VGLECFTDWQTRGTCGPPVLTAAYLSDDCEGTTGVFVVGHGFESSNLFESPNDFGQPLGPKWISTPQKAGDLWNVLTPTYACLTTSSDPSYWSGFTLQLQNPDGQTSNTVTVQNLLGARPPFQDDGGTDPFDPDACLDAGMTQAQALATFAPAASTSTLGSLGISSHTRKCNIASGCNPWGSPSSVGTVPAALSLTGGGHTVDFTLGGVDCAALGDIDMTLTYNACLLPAAQGGAYGVHVAAHCLWASSTVRSAVAGDGSYTQTDYAGLLHF
jgi:hypothetical protein